MRAKRHVNTFFARSSHRFLKRPFCAILGGEEGEKIFRSRKDANIFSNRCCFQKDASWFKFYAKGDFLNNSSPKSSHISAPFAPEQKKSTERLCSLQDRAWIGIASALGGPAVGRSVSRLCGGGLSSTYTLHVPCLGRKIVT